MSRSRTLSLDLFGDFLPLSPVSSNEPNRDHLRLLQALNRAVQEELTSRQLQCLSFYYNEKKSMAQIGRELGVSEATVSRHLKKARERLQRVLRFSLRCDSGARD